MKLRLHHYLELSGLIIVLFAMTLQLTLLVDISDISNKSVLSNIEEKINIIWFEINDPSKNTNYTSREQHFNSMIGEENNTDKQKILISKIYFVIMLTGSTLLVLGRWLEIRNEKIIQKLKQ